MSTYRSSRQVSRRQFCPCALLLAVLCAASLPAQQTTPIWTTIDRGPVATVEIDRARVHRVTATVAEAWTRVTYAQPDTLPEGDVYTSFIQHAVYDCERHRYRPAQMIAFDRTGRIIKVMAQNTSPDWTAVPPGTVADAQLRGACGMRIG